MLNPHAIDPLHAAILRLGAAEIPILRETVTRLEAMMEREDSVLPKDLAATILCDPLLTLHVLGYLQTWRPNRRNADITTIEHAIMMLGIAKFFEHFRDRFIHAPAVEDILAGAPEALAGFLAVASRARHAGMHARRWAVQRSDIESDEVEVAAMLVDLAELLLTIFDPASMSAIARRMKADPQLRSATVQREVLGYRISELQMALCREWRLPDLLCSLMDEHQAHRPRARNVLLAVALARHSAHGWCDAALPDDLEMIRDLLGLGDAETRDLIYRTTLQAVAQHIGPAGSAAWLPPPAEFMGRCGSAAGWDGVVPDLLIIEHVLHSLGSRQTAAFAAPGATRSVAAGHGLRRLDAIAVALHGMRVGLGFGRILWLEPDAQVQATRARFAVARQSTDNLRSFSLPILHRPMVQELFEAARAATNLAELQEAMSPLRCGAGGCAAQQGAWLMQPLICGDGETDWAMIYADDLPSSATRNDDFLPAFRALVEAVEVRLRS